jgi:hypothetical protein
VLCWSHRAEWCGLGGQSVVPVAIDKRHGAAPRAWECLRARDQIVKLQTELEISRTAKQKPSTWPASAREKTEVNYCATVMFGAGHVRIENVLDARIVEPTDAVVTVMRPCICGSGLWPVCKTTGCEHERSGRFGESDSGLPGAGTLEIKLLP